MACPRPYRERRRRNQSSGSVSLCPSKAHSDLYLAQEFRRTEALLPSWVIMAAPPGSHAGFPRPKLHKDISNPTGAEGR